MRSSSLCCSLIAAALATPAFAKLPSLSEEAKLKAAETAAKTAWNEKVGLYKHCLVIDRIAAKYGEGASGSKGQKGPTAGAGTSQAAASTTGVSALPAAPAASAMPVVAGGAPVVVTPVAPKASVAGTGTTGMGTITGTSPSAAPAGATSVASKDAKSMVPPAAPTGVAPPASSGGSGGVMAQTPSGLAPCVDPGPFVPPVAAAKPLEAAGAHSPAGTAVAPPNTQATAAGAAAGPVLPVPGTGGKTVVPATPVTSQRDKPLEMAEAHSPPGTAIGPPNVRANASQLDTGRERTDAAPAKPIGGGPASAR